MEWTESFRKAWVVTSLTLRYLLGTRRVIATALLAAFPLILTLSLAGARIESFDIILFQRFMVPLYLQVVLIFVTLVNATALIREEIDDNTLPFLLTRPISKPALVAYKYVGYLIAVLPLLVPPVVLAYGVTEAYGGLGFTADADVLWGFLATTILGTAAYGALFLFISVLVRRPLAVGLLIGAVSWSHEKKRWENANAGKAPVTPVTILVVTIGGLFIAIGYLLKAMAESSSDD